MRKPNLPNLDEMEFDELWQIHEELTKILSDRIIAEKRELEKRLAKLNQSELIERDQSSSPTDQIPRRKYPKVLPKYRNSQSPSETWSGRGKQPRWLSAALRAGHRLEDFRIDTPQKTNNKKGPPRDPQT